MPLGTRQELHWRKCELQRIRWRIENGRVAIDPSVKPAALCWLDGEINALNLAIAG
ncbi:hypothetical protein K0T92_14320 [Paenibacillus oenotherae]|uniref:Uncharacterized protein n=1 Tax=Paenibacillus oenotherae TaxID=1435645 RepID=A0ABS7D8R4_9BACL|nr:hypothetical protein [Paenibacillus oenotherae]MBW7475917.1 hypothetical protein [Paenibacillus oenotherae]